jgi:hypothetical protein
MIRSASRRIGVIVGVIAFAVATLGGFSAQDAGAATTNPCKVLKKSEIQAAFGGTVGNPKKGLTTPVSAQCEFQVSADGDRPSGTVTVHLMTKNGNIAFNGLKKISNYTPIEGFPNSLYGDKTHVVDVVKGKTLLGVQGGFLVTEPLPIHFYDDQQQLVDLAQNGLKRI